MKTYKELVEELNEVKENKWEELINAMEIGKPYTREELSEMSDGFFTKQFISGKISGCGDCRILNETKTLTTQYAEISPWGAVNKDNIITIERDKVFYTRIE